MVIISPTVEANQSEPHQLLDLTRRRDTKYSTAFSGKNSFISPYNCAASVLLCDMISPLGQIAVHEAEKLPAVALAARPGVGGQGVDIPARGGSSGI